MRDLQGSLCSKCKVQRDLYYSRYCRECRNEYSRKNRKRHSELNWYQKVKANCRSYLNVYISRGNIERGPCEVCGSMENVHGHHSDYTKPLQVQWLCKNHHEEHHSKRRELVA